MRTEALKATVIALSLAALPSAVVLAGSGSGGGAPPVCYVETWFNVVQHEVGGCATYSDCPGTVLCGIGSVDKNFSPITFGPYPCNDFTGGTMVGGVCTAGTPVIPSTVSTMIDKQSCSGGC